MTPVDMDVRTEAARKLARAYGDAAHEEAIVDFLCNIGGRARCEDFGLYGSDRRIYQVRFLFDVDRLDCCLCKGTGMSVSSDVGVCPLCEGRRA